MAFPEASEENVVVAQQEEEVAHPYAFHVSGPRNLSFPNWRDLVNSSWLALNSSHSVFAFVFMSRGFLFM